MRVNVINKGMVLGVMLAGCALLGACRKAPQTTRDREEVLKEMMIDHKQFELNDIMENNRYGQVSRELRDSRIQHKIDSIGLIKGLPEELKEEYNKMMAKTQVPVYPDNACINKYALDNLLSQYATVGEYSKMKEASVVQKTYLIDSLAFSDFCKEKNIPFDENYDKSFDEIRP